MLTGWTVLPNQNLLPLEPADTSGRIMKGNIYPWSIKPFSLLPVETSKISWGENMKMALRASLLTESINSARLVKVIEKGIQFWSVSGG